ncbi:hypothetical protein OROGR_024278 [Orobanche gracilis]
MPILDISTNVNLDGVNTDSLFSDLTKVVCQILGKPENATCGVVFLKVLMRLGSTVLHDNHGLNLSTDVSLEGVDTSAILSEASSLPSSSANLKYVMIVIKGSVPMAFGGTEQPAACGELVSIGGLNSDVNKKLSGAIASILETKLSIPKTRFYLKFYDTKGSNLGWNGTTF